MNIKSATDIEFDKPGSWSSMDFGEATLKPVPREPGLHASEVVDALVRAAGFAPAESSGWETKAIWEVGFCWEHVIQTAWKERRAFENRQRAILSQPRLELPINRKGDVLHLTPDAWDYIGKVEESYKSSTKSMRAFEEEPLSNFWGWFVQSKVYQFALNLPYRAKHGKLPAIMTSRFFVLWIRGDYRHPTARQRVYTVQFTREEVEETWRMVRAQARRMIRERKGEKA